jgi:hypothetical protein
MLSEWAYARLYATSAERADALPLWLSHYIQTTTRQPQPPIARLAAEQRR